MIKIYIKTVSLFVAVFLLVGLILPALISAKSTELVTIGFLLLIISIPLIAKVVLSLTKDFKTNRKTGEENEEHF